MDGPWKPIGDGGMAEVGQLRQLESLDIESDFVTDAGMASLRNLLNLRNSRCRVNSGSRQDEVNPMRQRLRVKQQLEKLVAKHKADGTLPRPAADDAAPVPNGAARATDEDTLVLQILHLGQQLPEAEVKQVWDEARRKEPDPAKQRLWVKEQFQKLIAKHKADGTLPNAKPGPTDPK